MTGFSISLADARELTRFAREGDEFAFATLVRSYQPMVFRWAIALSGWARTGDDQTPNADVNTKIKIAIGRRLQIMFGEGRTSDVRRP